jgi:hypothetical protein
LNLNEDGMSSGDALERSRQVPVAAAPLAEALAGLRGGLERDRVGARQVADQPVDGVALPAARGGGQPEVGMVSGEVFATTSGRSFISSLNSSYACSRVVTSTAVTPGTARMRSSTGPGSSATSASR